jgi:tetratricopeptide (TPR) repeat protein
LFGGDQRDRGLLLTQQAASSRSPFREAFRTSLLWIRYERGEYAEALRVVREARAIWPDNRLYRQAEGDVLFRLNRLPEALETYRTSFREYQGLETLPVGRLSAAGNLARIHAAMGQRDSARAWLDTLDAPRYRAVRRWLPASLVRDLAPVRRELSRP